MSPTLLLACMLGYFAILLGVAWFTGRRADNASFFIGNRNSHWWMVAFGMIGTSLSGVTFISVPGAVGDGGFTYFVIVLGQTIGYLVIALVLLPLYYRLKLTSIYAYLGTRLGPRSYRSGAAFFILSRTLGATARLYLVIAILQDAILMRLGVPFWLTTGVILAMILLYTYQGGVKTIVWTDMLQTVCMLAGLAVCAALLGERLELSLPAGYTAMREAGIATLWVTDPLSNLFWLKQLVAGVFIAIAMTGMDQEMMQKNISVRTLRDSQKNLLTMSSIMLCVVLLFLWLGGLLHLFAGAQGLHITGDQLFPAVVLGYLPEWVQIMFVIALISALFPSADGAITALTSSVCIDLIGMNRRDWDEAAKTRVRHRVHLGFAGLFLLLVLVFKWIANPSMIGLILKIAAFTYGPLLGLFAFGILTRRVVNDRLAPWAALAAPLLCYLLDSFQQSLLGGYRIGLEILLINGLIVFAGLWLLSQPAAVAADRLAPVELH